MKRFLKRYFDFSFTWGPMPRIQFLFRDNFYCYVWPQRSTHASVLKPGIWVNTHTDYYWLNMILRVDHRRPMNSK